jgi:hypothetical protein
MDQDRFDNLTRALARGTSRRQALKLLGGSLAGGLLSFLGVGDAAADDCKRNGKACKKNKQCCSGNCADGFCAPLCPPCDACSTCSGGTCVSRCGPGQDCLGNGTCATPCTTNVDCPGCTACAPDVSGVNYCANNTPDIVICTSDSTCPEGQFCGQGLVLKICANVC